VSRVLLPLDRRRAHDAASAGEDLARAGAAFTFRALPMGNWDCIVHCEVTVFEPPARLAYTWKGGTVQGAAPGSALDSVVEWTLTRVAESPVNLECRLTQILRLSDAARADLSSWLILGEVVGVRIARHLLDAGIYVTATAVPVMRGGGRTDYFEVGSSALFRMTQPA
jgi:hypothetical protein